MLDHFNPYTQALVCFLHNGYLGVFKELLRITLERIMRDDKKLNEEKNKQKRVKVRNINRVREIKEQIVFLQTLFNKFHNEDVKIKPLLKANGKLNITNWDGNDFIAFSHIAMLVFSNVLSPQKPENWLKKKAKINEKKLKTMEIW